MAGNINLGLPAQYVDAWYESGFNGALNLALTQMRNADTNLAYQYFSSAFMALQAIANEVPAVLTFGSSATTNYTYALASVPMPVAVGHISDWAYGLVTVPPLVAIGAMTDWAYGKASINLAAVGTMTG